jgi:hypothetical protein
MLPQNDPLANNQKNNLTGLMAATKANVPDLAGIDASAASSIEATKVPTVNLDAAQKMVAGGPSSVMPIGKAIVSDLQGQITAGQQQTANRALGTNLKATALKGVQKVGQASQEAAIKGQQRFSQQSSEDVKKAETEIAAMDSKGRALITEYSDTIEKWSTGNEPALVRALEANNLAYHQTSKQQERAVTEAYGKDSQKYADFLDNKKVNLQTMASDLIAKSWDMTQQMLQVGASGLSPIVGAVAQNLSWATKYGIDVRQAASMAVQQSEVDTLAYVNSVEAMKAAGMDDFANWLDQSPVAAIEMAPMLATLLDLQQTAAEEQRLIAEQEAAKPANRPNPYRNIA